MKKGRKFVDSLEEEKKAFSPYKNLFQSINNIPAASDQLFTELRSALPGSITEEGLLLSVKKNFNYFYDVTENSEGDDFKCRSGTTQIQETSSSKFMNFGFMID